MRYSINGVSFFLLLLLTTPLSNALAEDASPPEQPMVGPGGYQYRHAAVISQGPYWADGRSGNDNFRYYIYEPTEPVPEEAPVILFLHGWGGIHPRAYAKWIDHIVKKGYVLVWIQYQKGILTRPRLFTRNAIITWRDALKRLDVGSSQVRPARNLENGYKTAIVGHSAGGYLGAIIAAKAADPLSEIPRPYAVVAVEPGGLGIIPKTSFSAIDPDTKLIIVVGDEDNVVCKSTALSIWNDIIQIPDFNKDFLLVRSDYHGNPAQVSDHFFPVARDMDTVDARDFYTTFKISVGVFNCVFEGLDCEYALGDGSFEQIDMGNWSDGEPVIPMTWVEEPNSLETVCKDR